MKRIKVNSEEVYRRPGSIVSANCRANMVNYANLNSFNRMILVASTQNQFVCIENPEPPLVDSIYTDGLTYESSYMTVFDKDVKVLRRFDKHIMGKKTDMSILLLTDGKYLYTHIQKEYNELVNDYGYKNDGVGIKAQENDVIEAEEYIGKPDIFSPRGLCWGKNLYCIYNISGHTLEDAVRMRKETAENFKVCKVMGVDVVLNSKQRLKNIHGTIDNYKPIPDIGDCIDRRKAVIVTQFIEKPSQILTSNKSMMEISYSDTITYLPEGSQCVDMDLFASNEESIANEYLKQVYRDCKKFYTEYIDAVNELKNEYFLDVSSEYWSDFYKAIYIDGAGYLMPSGDNVYSPDTYILNMTFQKYEGLKEGQKISGMHGNKGVVSEISDDTHEIYELYSGYNFISERGKVVDVIVNTAGVPNRSNYGQLAEKYTNNIVGGIIEYHQDPDRRDLKMMYKDIMYVFLYIAPEMHDDIIEDIKDGVYTEDELMMSFLTKPFSVKTNPWPEPCHHPIYELNNAKRFSNVYKYIKSRGVYNNFIGKERLYILNDDGSKIATNIYAEVSKMYIIPLEHSAEKKFGARTKGYYATNGALAKTTRKKERTAPYAETPIQLGVRDMVVLTSALKPYSLESLIRFITTTDSEVVDSFKAILGQLGLKIEYNEEIISALRRIVQAEIAERESIKR